MKKILTYICAGALVLSTFSCAKDPWNFTPDNKKAAPLSPSQVAQKLNDTGVAVLEEADPDNWKEWGQSALKLYSALQNVSFNKAENGLADDLEDLMVAIEKKDAWTITTITIKLSLVKGDLKIVNDECVYTKSDNPLNLTYVYEGKTYVAKFEAKDSNNNIIVSEHEYLSEDKKEITILNVPTKAAIHVTENGKLFLDVNVYPQVIDQDKDGKFGQNDVLKGSATVEIPDYYLELNSLTMTADEAKARVALSHKGKRIFALDGGVEMELQNLNTKSVNELRGINIVRKKSAISSLINVIDDTEFNVLAADGKAVVKGKFDVEDLKKLSSEADTEAAAQILAVAWNKAAKADLFFDGNATVQASLVYLPVAPTFKDDADPGYWEVQPGIHFYDGSKDMTFEEFYMTCMEEEAFEEVIEDAKVFVAKLKFYYENLLPKKLN